MRTYETQSHIPTILTGLTCVIDLLRDTDSIEPEIEAVWACTQKAIDMALEVEQALEELASERYVVKPVASEEPERPKLQRSAKAIDEFAQVWRDLPADRQAVSKQIEAIREVMIDDRSLKAETRQALDDICGELDKAAKSITARHAGLEKGLMDGAFKDQSDELDLKAPTAAKAGKPRGVHISTSYYQELDILRGQAIALDSLIDLTGLPDKVESIILAATAAISRSTDTLTEYGNYLQPDTPDPLKQAA